MNLNCPACKQPQPVEIPEPKVTNLAACSVIVFEHPRALTCVCGQIFVPGVAGVKSAMFALIPVQKREPSRIITPN